MGACLKADTYRPDAPRSNCGSWLACDDGLPADTYRPDAPRSTCESGLAREGGLAGDPVIPSTYPFLRLRPLRVPPDGGSLSKSAKVTKALLPLHSAPRLGSVCPNTGLNPWAAATRHPWRGAANPASCRVTHEFKPAFGQRGLTGRLRSRSKADKEQIKSCSLRIVVTVGCYGLQSCIDTYAAIAVGPFADYLLILRHPRQASSHID